MVSLVFERVIAEDEYFRSRESVPQEVNLEELKIPSNVAPKGLNPCAADAYLMFQVYPTFRTFPSITLHTFIVLSLFGLDYNFVVHM